MELNNTPQHKSFLWHLDFEQMMDLMPETPFEGEPLAVTREPNNMEKSLL